MQGVTPCWLEAQHTGVKFSVWPPAVRRGAWGGGNERKRRCGRRRQRGCEGSRSRSGRAGRRRRLGLGAALCAGP